MRNRFWNTCKLYTYASKPSTGHRTFTISWSIGWMCSINVHPRTRAASFWEDGWGRCSVYAPLWSRHEALIWLLFFMNESGRHPVSVGYRISQPLWQIENHSASLCCVTHLGSWQEKARIKEFPFVRRLQIAAVVSLCGWQIATQLKGDGLLLICKRSCRSHRRFTEIFRTMCCLTLRNTFSIRQLSSCANQFLL